MFRFRNHLNLVLSRAGWHGGSRAPASRFNDGPRTHRRYDEEPRQSTRYGEPQRASHRYGEPQRASHRYNEVRESNRYDEEPQERTRHPQHLRGRDIGMWYAKAQNPNKTKKKVKLEYSVRFEMGNALQDQLNDSASKIVQQAESSKIKQLDVAPRPDFPEPINAPFSPRSQSSQISAFRQKLPVYQSRDRILESIERNQVTVIAGDTGSGKTTQIPQYVLEEFIQSRTSAACSIVCTLPKRIAVLTMARRVAEERGEEVGEQSVGYRMRLDSVVAPCTNRSIIYCTTGVVFTQLQTDPLLKSVTHLFVDEVHERSVATDLLLAMLKEKILPKRPDLKVICMSATIDSDKFVRYFGGDCGQVAVHGRPFEVENFFVEEFWKNLKLPYLEKERRLRHKDYEKRSYALQRYGYDRKFAEKFALASPGSESLNEVIAATVEYISDNKPPGAILVFVPGWKEITAVCDILRSKNTRSFNQGNTLIMQLHSLLPVHQQRQVFSEPNEGVRKVIVATSIAETSITIQDVAYVVDVGRVKISSINIDKQNLNCLHTQPISKANASQRLGRAGRTRPGQCYKLYTKMDYQEMEDFEKPEITRISLENVILIIKSKNFGAVEDMLSKCITAPSEKAIENSLVALTKMGILEEDHSLTTLGRVVAQIPSDPRIAKLLVLGDLFGCLDYITGLCACLDFDLPFQTKLGAREQLARVRDRFDRDSQSDHIMMANLIQESKHGGDQFADRNFLARQKVKMLHSLEKQYVTILNANGLARRREVINDMETLRAVICGGLFPNIAIGKFLKQPTNQPGTERVRAVRTDTESKIGFSKDSVIEHGAIVRTQFFAYFSKLKTDFGIEMAEASAVNPFSILLFTDTGIYDSRREVFVINDWIEIGCDPETAKLVINIRKALQQVLESHIRSRRSPEHDKFVSLLRRAFKEERPYIERTEKYPQDRDMMIRMKDSL